MHTLQDENTKNGAKLSKSVEGLETRCTKIQKGQKQIKRDISSKQDDVLNFLETYRGGFEYLMKGANISTPDVKDSICDETNNHEPAGNDEHHNCNETDNEDTMERNPVRNTTMSRTRFNPNF